MTPEILAASPITSTSAALTPAEVGQELRVIARALEDLYLTASGPMGTTLVGAHGCAVRAGVGADAWTVEGLAVRLRGILTRHLPASVGAIIALGEVADLAFEVRKLANRPAPVADVRQAAAVLETWADRLVELAERAEAPAST